MTRLGLHSTYVGGVLPALIPLGIGVALVFAPSISAATAGVKSDDAGVASAMVNTSQQVGGAIGTALLNTLFAASISDYLGSHGTSAAAQASAAVHGYSTAFIWAAVIFIVGAALSAIVLPSGPPAQTAADTTGELAFAH
jgi:hypothetical protein